MSKKYKDKTCAYCAAAGASETDDHVFAGEFVPVAYRPHIPHVPACEKCNHEKSKLEHYLATVLLFGGRHADAMANLQNDRPRRLAKNQRLRRELARGSERIWTREPSGLVVRALTVPIDDEKVERLVEYIVRGLMFHHWKVALGPDCFVDVDSLPLQEAYFAQYRTMRGTNGVQGDIGNGALVYEGVQGRDNPQISVWELSLFGGIRIADPDGALVALKYGAITGPQAIKDRAARLRDE
jgi:hypothetical protein